MLFLRAGSYYDGNWVNGKRHGNGKMFFSDKSVYDGEWENDKQNGDGRLFLPNGDMYQGHWKEGKRHGQGEFHFQNRAQILRGTWFEGISKCGELFEMTDKSKGIVFIGPFMY